MGSFSYQLEAVGGEALGDLVVAATRVCGQAKYGCQCDMREGIRGRFARDHEGRLIFAFYKESGRSMYC